MWSIFFIIIAPIFCGLVDRILVLQPSLNSSTVSALTHHAEYSPKEVRALLKLRSLTSDIAPEIDDYFLKDDFLIRFLRARALHVNDATIMYRNAMKWRKENRIDSILNETILESAIPSNAYTLEGTDFDGRPLVLFKISGVDVRKILLSGKRDLLLRWWVQMIEYFLNEIRKMSTLRQKGDPEITQFVAVLDMYGFSLQKHFCLQCPGLFIDWVKDYESYYPDYLKHFIFINTFKRAIPLLEVFRPFLSQATQKGFKIFGPRKQDWTEFLLSVIPAEQLPVQYGGTKIA